MFTVEVSCSLLILRRFIISRWHQFVCRFIDSTAWLVLDGFNACGRQRRMFRNHAKMLECEDGTRMWIAWIEDGAQPRCTGQRRVDQQGFTEASLCGHVMELKRSRDYLGSAWLASKVSCLAPGALGEI